jgi:D-sedoheptulose 7-phosphate isomerase
MDQRRILEIAADSIELKRRFFDQQSARLLAVGQRVAERLRDGGRILVFGNGGSAADAQHLVGELVVRFRRDRVALPALALTTDASVVTAMANDIGFEQVFSRQIEAHGRAGDVAIGISTSGESANVVAALDVARRRGLLTVGLTGRGGGRVAALVDELIDVPHDDTARIQEVHGMVVHILCEIIEDEVAP